MRQTHWQIGIAEKTADKHGQLPRNEWNFDGIPDEQLVACCYWEYARESPSIRQAVKVAKIAQAQQGIPKPETEEREVFRETVNQAYGLLFNTGFDPISFWVALPFPKAWQSVAKTKRQEWAQACPKIPKPLKFPPFAVTGDLNIASALQSEAMKVHKERQALYLRLSQIDSGVANLKEAAEVRNKLSELAKHPPAALLRGAGGADHFIAQINWRDFTDNEIVASFEQWVKAKGNRPMPVTDEPKGVRGLRGGRGHDPQNWRASLERLGIMRLIHHHSFDELQAIVPVGWLNQEKYIEKSKCKKEGQKAIRDFRGLFNFLSSEEKPRSWEPRPNCWKFDGCP
jgi:hypothetical protein